MPSFKHPKVCWADLAEEEESERIRGKPKVKWADLEDSDELPDWKW